MNLPMSWLRDYMNIGEIETKEYEHKKAAQSNNINVEIKILFFIIKPPKIHIIILLNFLKILYKNLFKRHIIKYKTLIYGGLYICHIQIESFWQE